MTAIARVIFFARNSDVNRVAGRGNLSTTRKTTGSRNLRIGMRIANPITLMNEKSISCRKIGFERESGYVQ
jgi:glycerol-3-phosphate dehydrogenase